jgi:membrane-associated phospholipid phosphatase
MTRETRRLARATRLASLPLPAHWLALAINGLLLVILTGLCLRLFPGVTAAELRAGAAASWLRDPIADALASAIAIALSPAANILILAGVCLVMLLRREPLNAIAFGFVVSVGWVLAEPVKLIVGRPRPDGALIGPAVLAKAGDDSFPSGHTAFATALVVGFCLLGAADRRRRIALVGGIAVAIVAASRVYGGAHHPTDVVAGVLLALAGTLLAAGAWNACGPGLIARLTPLERFGPLREPQPLPCAHRASFVAPRAR